MRVGLISIEGKSSYAACPSASACQFTYRSDATPSVDYMSLGGATGQTLKVTGRLLGLTPQAYTIRVGDANCDVSEDFYADDTRIIDPISRTGTVKCFAGGPLEAGRYNTTVRVHDAVAGYGDAYYSSRTQGVEPVTGRLYRLTVHPEVTSLSYATTGLGGGAELAISGSGFSWDAEDNDVRLGGVPCAVTSSTPNEIRCIPGPAPAASNVSVAAGVWYPGGRGLLHKLWLGNPVYNENPISQNPSKAWVNTDSAQGVSFNELEQYTQELTGFFVPPVTANYSFWVRGDDYAVVWLSPDASPVNKVKVAYAGSWVNSWAQYGGQVSAPVALQAGQPYWFQTRHTEGSSQDYFDIGLRIHLDGNPAAQAMFGTENHRRYRSVPEHQRIAITTDVTREMQRFVVAGAASGFFTLAVGGSVRTDSAGQPIRLAYNAAESAVSSYVRAVIGCDTITVVRSGVTLPGNVTGFAWNVTMGCPTDLAAWPSIVPYSVSLAPQPGVSEVTLTSGRVRTLSRPAAGVFRLAWNGSTSSVDVPARAAGWQIRQALLSIPGISNVEVFDSWTNTLDGGTWMVQINGPYGDVSPISVVTGDGNGTQWLTGSGVQASVTEVYQGSTDALLWPIPMDYFRSPLNVNAAVVVTTNGITGSCDPTGSSTTGGVRSNCTFVYDASLTPTISSADRSSVTAGDVITITGTGFLPASAGVGRGPGGTDLPPSTLNTVLLGSTPACNVTSSTATSITCTVLHTPAGTYTLRVVVGNGRGAAVPAVPGGSLPSVTYTATISGIAPSAGSLAGGTALTITGTGFQVAAANNTVTVGGSPCVITATSVTQLTCLTPAASGGAPGTVAVLVNGLPSATSFRYDASLTAQLSALSPRTLSTAISGTLTLSLTNLAGIGPQALDVASYTITVGSRACRVISLTPGTVAGTATVNCTLVRGPAAPLPQPALTPLVAIAGSGYASSGSLTLDAGFRIDAMSTSRGSLAGGTEVVLTGVGFSPRLYQVEVSFDYVDVWLYDWSVPAQVTSVADDGTRVTILVPAIPLWKRGHANSTTPQAGTLTLRVNNITAPCAPSLNGCAFTQSIDYTPVVTDVRTSGDGRTLTVLGSSLWSVTGTTTVSIGPFPCEGVVVAPAADALNCTIPPATAGTYDVTVFVTGWGSGRSTATYTLPMSLGAGWPASAPIRGSIDGGSPVTLVGAGFAADDITRNVVRFGSTAAVVVAANFTHLTLLTPPVAAAGTVDVTVRVLDDVMTGAIAAETTLPAAFTYDSSLSYTPTLASVTPRQGFAGQALVIRGAGFGNVSSDVSVTIGGEACVIDGSSAFNSTFLACALGNTPAGIHKVLVRVGSKGYARGPTIKFTSLLEVSGQAGANSGLGGGRLVTLTGRGFPAGPGAEGQVIVGACNTRCSVLSSSYNRLVCASSPLVTREALASLRVWQPSSLVPIRLPTGASTFAMDGSVDTSFTSCTVDIDLGPDTLAVMTSVKLYPKYGRTRNAQGARFLGRASASANWTTLATLSSQYVQEGWNEFNVDGYSPANNYASVDWMALPAVRFLRFAFPAGAADCTANEVAFMGIPVSPSSVCPLNVTVATTGGSMTPFTGAINPITAANSTALLTYDLPTSSVVTGISPEYRTALGGDVITLAGSGFPSSPADVIVTLNGMPCTVLTSSAAAITCRTSPRTDILPLSVNVTVTGDASTGTALYDPTRVYFRYLDRWSALTTWKYQEPPIEGDSVVVPPGQSILVDVSPPRLFLVLVQGDLVFDRRDLAFDASYIFVHGGRFEVGTEALPFTNKLTITLHGDRRESIEIPEVGAKMLAVMPRSGVDHSHAGMTSSTSSSSSLPGAPQMAAPKGYSQGFLELHGEPRKRVWTRIAAAIPAGSDVITTAEDVDWRAGETLIVTNTLDYDLTESVTVTEVMGPRSLRIKGRFANHHDCKTVPAGQYGQPDVIMCAEVALLSRNVVVRGDPDKSPRQLFGVHTGAMHGGVYHVENIELTHCGQQGLLGRYCTHFHMTSDNWDSYVRFNSIHHSFQRATTIHATNHALVKHNVAYDVFGHTIFVEDGVEQYTVIEENLVVHTKPCGMCISSDKKPANYWMASPTCIWRHNVASGSTHFGFWFELPNSPHGPSYTPSYCPVNMPLGEFFNNTAHSSSIGLRIYPQFFPMQNGCEGGGTAPQYFRNNTYFHNGQGMFHRNIGDVHHVDSRWIENWGEDVSWKIYRGVEFDWDPNIVNGLFICNTDGSAGGCGTRAITAPQDEYWYAKGLTLVNYRSVGALAGCHSCNDDEDYKQVRICVVSLPDSIVVTHEGNRVLNRSTAYFTPLIVCDFTCAAGRLHVPLGGPDVDQYNGAHSLERAQEVHLLGPGRQPDGLSQWHGHALLRLEQLHGGWLPSRHCGHLQVRHRVRRAAAHPAVPDGRL